MLPFQSPKDWLQSRVTMPRLKHIILDHNPDTVGLTALSWGDKPEEAQRTLRSWTVLTEPEKKRPFCFPLHGHPFHLLSHILLVLLPHPVSETAEPVPLLDDFTTQIENISLCSHQVPEIPSWTEPLTPTASVCLIVSGMRHPHSYSQLPPFLSLPWTIFPSAFL